MNVKSIWICDEHGTQNCNECIEKIKLPMPLMNKEERLKQRIRELNNKMDYLYDKLVKLNPDKYSGRFEHDTSKITLGDVLA